MSYSISVQQTNPAISDPTQNTSIYQGVETTINTVLTNTSDTDLSIPYGGGFMLRMTFADMSAMVIPTNNLTPWHFGASTGGLTLTYKGTDPYLWAKGAPFSFAVTNVTCNDAPPKTVKTQITCQGFTPSNPPVAYSDMSLISAPVEGNADLTEVLQVFLNNQGTIYRSSDSDPLENTLYLNFKNIGNGPISTENVGVVTVSFVYGSTAGALAPADNSDGSAFGITASVSNSEDNSWTTEALTNGDDGTPYWELSPNNDNVIGTGAHANVTFAFSNIISNTPTGNTQMRVSFSGFKQDADTDYDDAVFVLNIVKLAPPALRGILNFYSQIPNFNIYSNTKELSIDLYWSTYFVDQLKLYTNIPEMGSTDIDVTTNSKTITFSNITDSGPISMTLQALDNNGHFLNSLQFSIYIQVVQFIDLDGKIYPTAKIGSQIWMAANYDYNQGSGCGYYQNNPGAYEDQYGRLYTLEAALLNIPDGWRLPTKQDWDDLIGNYASATDAYTALIDGGDSGFNAQLGGFINNNNISVLINNNGCYWSNTGEDPYYNVFYLDSGSSGVYDSPTYPSDYMLSVRYVKDLD